MHSEQIDQRTEQWANIRYGRFTGSEFWKLTVEPKSKKDKEAGVWSATALTYIMERLQERMMQAPLPGFSSAATDWGNENESLAISRYEEITGNKVRKVGFVTYGENAGCSPDGLVSFDGIIEVKCPYKNYLSVVYENPADNREHYCQIQFELMTTGRKWCDYIVFDPRMEKPFDIVIRRILRDEQKIAELEKCLLRGEITLNELYRRLAALVKENQLLVQKAS